MYDVIVVGARCAGSPTAMLLARRGYRVLVLDKATFPSDTISSHYLHQRGVAQLARWRLLDRVAATDAPGVTKMTFDAGAVRLRGSPPPVDGVVQGYCVRRKILDKILLDAAVETGAEVRQGFTVTEILRDGDRVTGIRGHASGGKTVTERARLVVGADGVRSVVARAVDAPFTRYAAPLTCNYYSYFANLPVEGVELFPRDGCFIVATPTNDGLTSVNVVWPAERFDRVRVDVERFWAEALERHAPCLAERMRAAARAERFYGTPMVPNYLRKPFGDGWALVGDAGYMKDPITAQGMTDAFRDADALAGAIHTGFAGRSTMDEALARYEQQRDEHVMPMFLHTCELANLAAMPAQMLDLLRAIEDRPEEVSQFLGTTTGATPVDDFYAPQNVARLLGAPEPVAA
jgi:2-polyprenyl-6-methoxyphenol hydroxylase-like FAD-dependent oxidoreductase